MGKVIRFPVERVGRSYARQLLLFDGAADGGRDKKRAGRFGLPRAFITKLGQITLPEYSAC